MQHPSTLPQKKRRRSGCFIILLVCSILFAVILTVAFLWLQMQLEVEIQTTAALRRARGEMDANLQTSVTLAPASTLAPTLAPTETPTVQKPLATVQKTQSSIATAVPTRIPSPTATNTPRIAYAPQACTLTTGRYVDVSIPSQYVTEVKLHIYLPPCYPARDYAYPVLYLLHGQLFKLDQWDRLGADEALEKLLAVGNAPPFIIVMPQEYDGLIDQWESKYGDLLVEDVVPYIDTHYQTCNERTCRAIGGLSRGAGWAARIGLMNWQTFGAIGLHSFAPFRGDYNAVPIWVREIPVDQLPHIYMDIGVLDFMLDPATQWEIRLKNYGVPHEWHINLGTHNEEYWSKHTSEYIRWYGSFWLQRYINFLTQQGLTLERKTQ